MLGAVQDRHPTEHGTVETVERRTPTLLQTSARHVVQGVDEPSSITSRSGSSARAPMNWPGEGFDTRGLQSSAFQLFLMFLVCFQFGSLIFLQPLHYYNILVRLLVNIFSRRDDLGLIDTPRC